MELRLTCQISLCQPLHVALRCDAAFGSHYPNINTCIPTYLSPCIYQDRYLPIANIARIMKNTLPENAKIAKDSKETVQECVSEFISFITSEASDKCLQEKRKTINGDDLLWAMSTLGFDKYVEPLKLYLSKYREAVRGDKPEKHPAGRAANSPPASNTANPMVPGDSGLPPTM